MKRLVCAIIVSLALAPLGTAWAATLYLAGPGTPITTGSSFDVDLRVTQPEGFGVGDFDVDILYDTSLMAFTDYSLGTSLGDPLAGDSLDDSQGEFFGAGRVDLAQVSLLPFIFPDPQQAEDFLLATLTFRCTGVGVSNIGIDPPPGGTGFPGTGSLALGDWAGLPLEIILGDPITISQVPEPTTMVLLGTGLLGTAAIRRRKKTG